MPLRLVMMGTGTFALPVFRALYGSPHTVAGLFTQPDRTGRGHHRHVNPLKELATEHGTPVFQPQSINTPEAVASLRDLNADLGVVAAYGQILKPAVIEAPRLGCINVHASLLPKYRGAAPILYAILNGETETGVTIFQIAPKLDAGLMLGSVKTPIGSKETSGDLQDRLAELAVPLTMRVIDEIEQGTTHPETQNPDAVTRAPSLKKSAGRIDWSQSAARIANHVRAMQPWPTPFTFLEQPGGQPLRVILTEVEVCGLAASDAQPGELATADQSRLIVQTGEGGIEILKLRPEGKRELSATEFQHGHGLQPGDRFEGER